MSHTDSHIDRLDIIDELNKELSSLNSMHLLLHSHLKSALSSNDEKMTSQELRDFNCGIDNLVNPRFAKVSKLLKRLAQATI